MFIFDGNNRRFENLYPPEQLVARRVKLSESKASSSIFAVRLLSDGETTLRDTVDVDLRDDKTILHTPACSQGTKLFCRMSGEHVPLGLTDPDPPRSNLGRCLRDFMDGREAITLTAADESAVLNGIAVVKLAFELSNPRMQITFWVDLEHGAMPVQTRLIEEAPDNRTLAVFQQNLSDIRWVAKGWLPFRKTVFLGHTSKPVGSGDLAGRKVRETVVDDADFETRPASELFEMEFPEEIQVIDTDRLLAYGRRRVWRLIDFGPAARSRAEPIRVSSPTRVGSPAMPDALAPRSWWPATMVALGMTCVLIAGALLFRKVRHHAA